MQRALSGGNDWLSRSGKYSHTTHLYAWLKPDMVSGLVWNDSSGFNNHFTAKQTVVAGTQKNGINTISLSGNWFSRNQSKSFTKATVIAVANSNMADGQGRLYSIVGSTPDWNSINSVIPIHKSAGYMTSWYNGSQISTVSTPYSGWGIFINRFGNGTIQNFIYKPGGAYTSPTSAFTSTIPSTMQVIGEGYNGTIGADADGSWNGDIAEIMIFDDYITDQDLEVTINALRVKYMI